jgi:hypothetical protein
MDLYFDDDSHDPRQLFYNACQSGDLALVKRLFETGRVVIALKGECSECSYSLSIALNHRQYGIIGYLNSIGVGCCLEDIRRFYRII